MKKDLSHLSDLQKAEFNVFLEFDRICKKYDINYYLTGGTLLGAVRHKGFIPWDDDIDIAITRKNYIRFAKVVEKELPDNIYFSTFDTPGHIWLVPRLIDKSTRFYLNNATDKKAIGAWIDILIIDGIPDPGLKRNVMKAFYLLARMLYQFSNFSTAVNLHRKGRPWYEYAAIRFAQLTHVEKILNPKAMGHFYDWVCRWYDLDKCNYGAALSGAIQFKETCPKEWFGEGKPVEFEGMIVNGYDDSDKFLTYIYGDYMTPPPMDERNKHNVTKVED